MTQSRILGTMVALAAGSLFSAACSKGAPAPVALGAGEKTAMVHCAGINDCKGHGTCKTEKNACAGQNECKGQGITDVAAAADCTAKGGTVQ
jgi:hypothetical protein